MFRLFRLWTDAQSAAMTPPDKLMSLYEEAPPSLQKPFDPCYVSTGRIVLRPDGDKPFTCQTVIDQRDIVRMRPPLTENKITLEGAISYTDPLGIAREAGFTWRWTGNPNAGEAGFDPYEGAGYDYDLRQKTPDPPYGSGSAR